MNDSERKHEIFLDGRGYFRYREVHIQKIKGTWKVTGMDLSSIPIKKEFRLKEISDKGHTKRGYMLNDIDRILDGNAVSFITR